MSRFRVPFAVALTLSLGGLASAGPAWAQEEEEELEIEVEASPAPPTPPAEPSPEPPPATPPAPAVPDAVAAENEALRALIQSLEARISALEQPAPEVEAAPDVPAGLDPDRVPGGGLPRPARWWDAGKLVVSGYVQAQAEFHQLSEDEVSPDGAALNQDRFLVRRGRLRVDRAFKFAHVAIELDANTVRGPFVSLRRAEASFFYPNTRPDLPPFVMVTAGLSEIPFGFELRQGHRQRVFMERTTGSLAFFRGEPDVGVRLSGAVGPLRYAFAVQNGVPLDDRPNAVSVPFQRQKTGLGRLGFEIRDPDLYEAFGGVSFLAGTGFHAGSPETKSDIDWRDLNQDGNVTLSELVATPAQAATPSTTFKRWAVNADAGFGVRSRIGWTRVMGEVTVATNLDRAYFVADPVSTGYDLRELSWFVAIVQEITPYGLIGFRADAYNPNADLFGARRGLFIPEDPTVTTLSPVIGGQLPGRARLLLQYDHLLDSLGRDTRGEPIDLPNNHWTLRLQVEY